MRKRPDYLVCYERGRRFASRSFMIFVHMRPCSEPGFRFGMAVSKKVGSAVRRNRVKRLLREFFRLRQHEIREAVGNLSEQSEGSACLDFVCVVKRSAKPESMAFEQVDQELWPVLNKAFRAMGKESRSRQTHQGNTSLH